MRRRPGLAVLALSLLSLAGFTRWQGFEESLASAWLPALRVVDSLSPARVAPAEVEQDPALIAELSEIWRAALLARPPASFGRELRIVPVLSVNFARRELLVAVPPNSVQLEDPVTHQGRYVGSLCSWSADDRVVVRNGRARVALPGHSRARPIAGEWRAAEGGLPLNFLVRSEAGQPAVTNPSRRMLAAQGQSVFTRNVRELGDDLPAGLLLGTLQLTPVDRPGGGFDFQNSERANLQPAIRPEHLGYVVLELAAGATLSSERRAASWLGAPRADGTQLRLDQGSFAGVELGHWVVSGTQLLGVIGALGPLSARVNRVAPPGLLYVEDGALLVPVARELQAWPRAWQPQAGQRVWVGHRELGALLFGHVSRVHARGVDVEPLSLPSDRQVQVVEP